jgi:hypothetical protein
MKARRINRSMTGKHRNNIRNKSGKLLYRKLTEVIISTCYEIHYKYGS